MTAIAGLWGGQTSGATSTLLDAMGPRAAFHRSTHEIMPGLTIGGGHHLARPREPMVIHSGFAVVLDARLEQEDGFPLRDAGRAVIDLYRTYGVAGFARLRGEFALALWDPAQRRLVCARDALGVRPLVFRNSADAFAFASEERGLAPLFGRERLCDLRVAEYFGGLAPPADCGMRSSVVRLLPGVAAITDGRSIEHQRFDALRLPEVGSDATVGQAETFSSLLRDAVARRCAGERQIDCFLSGGLDSSSIVLLAAAQSDRPIRTLSLIDSARPELSERPFIDAVIQDQGFEVILQEVGHYDPFAGAVEALRRHAGPVAAPNLLMMRPLYQMARNGSVLLDGHGGDEVVSKGSGRLLDLARSGQWVRVYRELRGVADLYGDSAAAMVFNLYLGHGPGRHKLAALRRVAARAFGRAPEAGDIPLDLLSAEFRDRSGIDAAIQRRWRASPASGREAELRVLTDSQQTYALEVLDREAQDAGVEGRCPFWDRALINYSLSLPPQAKLQDGWTRLILRRAMADVLPPKVLWRRDKHDFSAQLREGLRRSPVVSPQAIEAARPRLSAFLDVDKVLALRARLEREDQPVTGQALQALWRVGLWSLWCTNEDTPARPDL